MREMHLFAGAGGGILGGMLLGHTPVCAVEFDPYCQRVLRARQADGWLPAFPIYGDVREFDGKPWRGKVDVVAGGFPCQPWSSAGKRKGAADERHLWPEMARIVEEVRPRYVFAENVSLAAFAEPWRDLRRLGYRVPPAICVAAADVGAPHLRKRWWLLASDAEDDGHPQRPRRARSQREVLSPESAPGCWEAVGRQLGRCRRGVPDREAAADADRESQHAFTVDAEVAGAPCTDGADADRSRLEVGQSQRSDSREELATALGAGWWESEPDVGRVADGVASRVDRLRAIGNGQVPLVAATAWQLLKEQIA